MPLTVKEELVLRRGVIDNDSTSLLSLGTTDHQGKLFADTLNALVFSSHDTVFSVEQWNGGWVKGPFKRYFQGPTADENSIMPVGEQTRPHAVGILFENTDTASVTLSFHGEDPGFNGLPLFNEQGTNIVANAPNGYWEATHTGITGLFDLSVNAHGFTSHNGRALDPISEIRIVNRPHNGEWQHSATTTTSGPQNLNKLTIENLDALAEFGVGIGIDTSQCNAWVYETVDNMKGSLRFQLKHCVENNDTLNIASFIDTITLNIDSIQIDKNVFVTGVNDSAKIHINGPVGKPVFEVLLGKIVEMENMTISSEVNTGELTLINKGTLILNNVLFKDKTHPAQVLNVGTLLIKGNVMMK